MIEALNQKIVYITPPGAIVDAAGVNTTVVDTDGFDHMTVILGIGATDIAMAALKLQMSEENNANFADVEGADFSVDGELPGAGDDNKLFAIHVKLNGGKKRFFDLVATGGDGTAGAYFTAFAILSRAKEAPESAAERGFAQELFV